MAYSEGFSPRPRIHYGLALSTGCESHAEYIDLDLATPIQIDDLGATLSDALPDGVEITGVSEVASNADALQAVVSHCTWEFDVVDSSIESVDRLIAALMAREEVPLTFERKGKSVTENIRPALISASVGPELRNDDGGAHRRPCDQTPQYPTLGILGLCRTGLGCEPDLPN